MVKRRANPVPVAFHLAVVVLLTGWLPGSGHALPGAAQEAGTVVRFAVIGDSGTGKESQYKIAEQMARWHQRLPFDVVLMLGDNIYGAWWGGGNKKDFEKKFDRPYAELLRRGVVFRASLGNHDVRESGGRHLIEDRERFHIEGKHGYYSFTEGSWNSTIEQKAKNEKRKVKGGEVIRSGYVLLAGAEHLFQADLGGDEREFSPRPHPAGTRPLVEFFALNTTRIEKDKDDPAQLAWLEKALQESRARWRIAYGHHALYSTGKRHGADLKLRAKLEPIFAGQVQVGLAGHDHIYQRFHPQRGIVYFVSGSSGQLRRGNARPDPAVAAGEYRLHVFLLWEATPEELRFRAINERGKAFDCGVILNGGQVEEVPCSRWEGLTKP